jgi:hypothetical protein
MWYSIFQYVQNLNMEDRTNPVIKTNRRCIKTMTSVTNRTVWPHIGPYNREPIRAAISGRQLPNNNNNNNNKMLDQMEVHVK